jgi:glucose/arabinose dehydrogenase
MRRTLLLLALTCALACSCRAQPGAPSAPAAAPGAVGNAAVASIAGDSPVQTATDAVEPVFAITEIASFAEPWALAFLPDGRLLVTEKRGKLRLVQPGGMLGEVSGVPAVSYGGQGGFGDLAVHPDFGKNGLIYLSYAEAGEGGLRGAAVARARLTLDD